MATRKLDVFIEQLLVYGDELGLPVSPWQTASNRTNKHLLLIETSPVQTVLYVKDSALSPAFWGLNSNQISVLRQSDVDWYIVLLVGPDETSYLLHRDEFESAVVAERWSFSKDDWKVHERQDLQGVSRYSSFRRLFDEILEPKESGVRITLQDDLGNRFHCSLEKEELILISEDTQYL